MVRPDREGERVARDHQGTLFGHYDIECLLKTSQATPLVMWGSLRDSQTNIVAATKNLFFRYHCGKNQVFGNRIDPAHHT